MKNLASCQSMIHMEGVLHSYVLYMDRIMAIERMPVGKAPKQIMRIATSDVPNGFRLFCGDEPLERIYYFCRGHMLPYSCIKSLTAEVFRRLEAVKGCFCCRAP